GLSICPQPISATFRKPCKLLQLCAGQTNAIRNIIAPPPVIAALCGVGVEQFAGDIGHIDLAIILVFRFQQATFAAPVAKCLPLSAVERVKRRFPKGLFGVYCIHRLISSAISWGVPSNGRSAIGSPCGPKKYP